MDSSGNGHRLKTFRPTIPQGGILGCLMGSTIQNDWEIWSNGSSSSSSSIYFNSTTSISQYSNKCIQYRHNGKLNMFLDIR